MTGGLERLSREQAQALGLTHMRSGRAVLVRWPRARRAMGAPSAPAPADLRALLSGAPAAFDPLGLSAAEGAGVALDLLRGGRVLRARARPNESIGVRSTGPAASWGRPEGDESGALVDLDVSGPVLLTLPNGELLVLNPGEQGLAAETWALPPAEWARGSEDEWLATEMAQRLQRGTAWDEAVAAGMYVRLSLDARAARDSAAAALAGRRADAAAWPILWIRSLDESRREAIESEGQVHLSAASDRLAWLEANVHPLADDWLAALHTLAREREEAECALGLLAQVSAGQRLAGPMDEIDGVAERVLKRVALPLRFADEILLRAAGADPTSRWSRLASPP